MPALIELNQLVKNYGSFRALNNISLSIQPGITGLLGPNGAGKSTLIKVLLGLLKVNSGTGSVLGYKLGSQNREIRSAVGFMPEDDCYFSGISGVESMQFMARLSSIPSLEALRRSHEILDFCGVGQERYRLVETYSTGMRQKLRFAQSLVHDPQLLILDEPTTGLDPTERESTLNRIKVLGTKHNKSVLLCTHILPDVQSVCESVVILAKGNVQVADSLENLSRSRIPTLNVKVERNHEDFVRKLNERGLQATRDVTDTVQITGVADEIAETIWSVAIETDAEIHSFVPSRTSLESIFLKAVAGESIGAE